MLAPGLCSPLGSSCLYPLGLAWPLGTVSGGMLALHQGPEAGPSPALTWVSLLGSALLPLLRVCCVFPKGQRGPPGRARGNPCRAGPSSTGTCFL